MGERQTSRKTFIKGAFALFGLIMIILGLMGFADYPKSSGSSVIAGAIVMVGGIFIIYRVIFDEGLDWLKKDKED